MTEITHKGITLTIDQWLERNRVSKTLYNERKRRGKSGYELVEPPLTPSQMAKRNRDRGKFGRQPIWW